MADDGDQDMDGVQDDQEEVAKGNKKEWEFSPEMKENIDDTFDTFDKNKEERVERTALGPVLRWLGFNPTERELLKYSDMYD